LIPAAVAGAATAGPPAAPQAASAVPSYTVTSGHATRLAQAPAGVSGLPAVTPANSPLLASLRGEPGGDGGDPGDVPARAVAQRQARLASPQGGHAASAPVVTATPAAPSAANGSASRVVHQFNGVSDLESDALADSPVTPPDQGLCVGKDTTLKGDPDAVWEPVNLAAQETNKAGAVLRPAVDLGTLYQDPFFGGDPRCLYDPASKTFYFTDIGFPVATGPADDANNTTVDVAVMNVHGVAEYQFDTSLGGQCFGDQPKVGFDNDALVVATDQYCGSDEADYEGAAIVAISKSQLAAEATTVNDDVLGPVSIAGNPITGLDPAISTGSGTEYFVDSTSFIGAADTPAPPARDLGFSTLTDTASVTTGHGQPRLASKVVPSEEYAAPVPATSTGDSSTSTLPDGTVVTAETALAQDDQRTSGPVNVTRDPAGGLDLWTNVDTALTPRGDNATRDGSAWFEISTARQRVIAQGYTAVKGAYLIYPAIEALPHGPVVQVFTITSSKLNPSIAYNELGSGAVTTLVTGAGPHVSFSDDAFDESRWGDYSMAVPDPDGSGIWLATEYIPPAADQDPQDNWGTYVFELPADHR
jgi:hypothetical protein